jgi:hypothetical protein
VLSPNPGRRSECWQSQPRARPTQCPRVHFGLNFCSSEEYLITVSLVTKLGV